MHKFGSLAMFSILATSCNIFGDDLKHLDEQKFRGKDFTVVWYHTSDISSVHEHVELSRWGYNDKIMECEGETIYNVIITGDTITIQTIQGSPIYELAAKKNGCIIKIDSTVTNEDYIRKFRPEFSD